MPEKSKLSNEEDTELSNRAKLYMKMFGTHTEYKELSNVKDKELSNEEDTEFSNEEDKELSDEEDTELSNAEYKELSNAEKIQKQYAEQKHRTLEGVVRVGFNQTDLPFELFQKGVFIKCPLEYSATLLEYYSDVQEMTAKINIREYISEKSSSTLEDLREAVTQL